MEFWLARAMQDACLEAQDLSRIHAIEDRQGYCMANFCIQDILGLPSIYEKLVLSEDENAQRFYADKIRQQFKSKKLVPQQASTGEEMKTKIHEMDWYIVNQKAEFDFAPSGGKMNRGKLKSLLSLML